MNNLPARIALVFAAALTLSPIAASAKELWEQPWIEVRSPHFVIVSALPEDRTVNLAHDLENFRAAVQMITTIGRFEERIPTTLYVLPYRVKELGFRGDICGYFRPAMRANYAAVIPIPGAPLDDTLKHEYVHFLVHNRDSAAYPPWFDEGFAELMATLDAHGDSIQFGRPSSVRVEWLGFEMWMPFETVIGARNLRGFTQDNTAMFYAQSWALMHYLMNGRPARKFNVDNDAYLAAVEAGVKPVQAFEQAFGLPVAGLKNALKIHLSKELAVHRITISPAIPEAPTHVRAMSRDDIAAQLGSLALVWEQNDAAKRYWDAAVALNPNNATAIVGLGDLHKFAGRFDEAAPYYEKAIAADPSNAYPELDYGEYFIDRAEAEKDPAAISGYLAEARRHLARSYKLDADVPETLAMNGWTYMGAGESLDKALQSLTAAYDMLPSQPDIKMMLAKAYVRSGDRESATRLLRSLAAWSHGDNGEEANQLLQQLGAGGKNDAAAAAATADD